MAPEGNPPQKQPPAQKQQFKAMPITDSPLRKDIVGKSGEIVDDFVLAINSEDIFRKMSVSPDKTFLITGAPGTGKTLGIKALINELNRITFEALMLGGNMPLNIVGMSYDIGKYGTAYINEGSKIVQSFFDTCYSLSIRQKVLIAFDEAEVLFGARGGNKSHKEDDKVLDTIMKNMQIVHDRPNMYAVMMSNFPDAFDEASIRAGRIDKRYELELPNELERKLAYDHTIYGINEKSKYQVVRCYDSSDLAKLSEGYSYADIVESVNAAIKKRAIEIARTRKDSRAPAGYVTQKRLEDAVLEHTKSFIPQKRTIGFR
jgi:SpoVK/Ycf46/Vps4 family AAA+-type ATPase